MPALGLVKRSIAATGLDIGPGARTVFAEGTNVSVVLDQVSSHGEPPHAKATIVTGSGTVFAEGRPVVVAEVSTASCGHRIDRGAVTVQVT
jgi:uncharacterized Zn-binding protein involved in type VI secretion